MFRVVRALFAFALVCLAACQPNVESAMQTDQWPKPLEGPSSLWGYAGSDGRFVILPKYHRAHPFREQRAMVCRESADPMAPAWPPTKQKCGYIDGMGQEVIPLAYDEATDFSEGLAGVRRGRKWGFISPDGKERVPFDFDVKPREGKGGFEFYLDGCCYEFSEGRSAVRIGNKIGYIDRAGKIVANPDYDDARQFAGGRAAVFVDGKWGYLDSAGNVAVPFKFKDALTFHEGVASVRENDLYGYIDPTGRWLIPPRFAQTTPFVNGVASVSVDGRWGVITRSGQFLLAPAYETAIVNDGFITLRETDDAEYREIPLPTRPLPVQPALLPAGKRELQCAALYSVLTSSRSNDETYQRTTTALSVLMAAAYGDVLASQRAGQRPTNGEISTAVKNERRQLAGLHQQNLDRLVTLYEECDALRVQRVPNAQRSDPELDRKQRVGELLQDAFYRWGSAGVP